MPDRIHQPHTVAVKARWADEWTDVPGLYCDVCRFASSPDVADAQLSYLFGLKMRAAATNFVAEGIKNYDDFYVRITIAQGTDGTGEPEDPKRWYGVIVDTQTERFGIHAPNHEETGRQIFTCRGLEYLLQRTVIDRSIVKSGTDAEKEIQRAIAFNLGSGDDSARFRQNNRAAGYLGEHGTHIFSDKLDEENAGAWYGHDIVEYLLAYYSPRDNSGEVQVPFELDLDSTTTALRTLTPTLRCHGRTLKQILDDLIDRRRLMSWYVEVRDSLTGSEKAFIVAFTFNNTEITLPSARTIKANADQQIVFTDYESDIVSNVQLAKDTATRFDVVIARGERLGACFTINHDPDGTLEKDWDAALQTAYNTGATGAAGYGALNSWEQQDANAAVRADDRFLKVYRYFRVPPAWSGKLGSSETIACPDPEDDTKSAAYWYPGMRFKPYLPLLTEVDYEDGVGSAATIELLDGSKHEYRRPFAFIYDVEESRYYQLDKLSQSTGIGQVQSGGRDWSASLRMQDEAFGIIVDVNGWDQHAIAKTEFSGSEGAAAPAFPAEMYWENIHATVFAEFDQYAEVKWPEGVLVADDDQLKRLIINVPNARLDYLTPGTLIKLNDLGQALATSGGYVRDDREFLKDVARVAYEWYGQTRQAAQFTQRDLISGLSVGTLITKIGNPANQIEVNTVVTQMVYDLMRGEITIRTQFAELDLRG
jgi:hypothetical protein